MKKTAVLFLFLLGINSFRFSQEKEDFNVLLIHVDDLGASKLENWWRETEARLPSPKWKTE